MTDLSELLELWRREAEERADELGYHDECCAVRSVGPAGPCDCTLGRLQSALRGLEKLREQRDRGVYNGAHFQPGITEKVIIGSFDAEILREMEKPK